MDFPKSLIMIHPKIQQSGKSSDSAKKAGKTLRLYPFFIFKQKKTNIRYKIGTDSRLKNKKN